MDGNCHRDYDSRRVGNPPSLVAILWILSILYMVTFLGMVSRDHDHPGMKKMIGIGTIIGMVTLLGKLAIIEYV